MVVTLDHNSTILALLCLGATTEAPVLELISEFVRSSEELAEVVGQWSWIVPSCGCHIIGHGQCLDAVKSLFHIEKGEI